jgi:hypothetical protein
MNYQHKYLKYKSKYLEKKYGHIQIFKYKVNNDNDLNYKKKYLKYKSKYLDIKYGGIGSGSQSSAIAFALLPRDVRYAFRGAELLGSMLSTGTQLIAQKATTVAPAPAPAPAPVPAAKPTPTPVPAAKPTPTPVPAAKPTPVPAAKPTPTPVPAAKPTQVPAAKPASVPVTAAKPAPVPAAKPTPAAATPAAASTTLFSKFGNKIGNLAKSAGTMISNLNSKPTFIADAMRAHMVRNQNDSRSEPDTRNYYKTNNDMIFKTTILKDIQKESTKHPEIAEAIRSVLLIHKTKDPKLLDFQTYLENLVISYNAEKDKKKK